MNLEEGNTEFKKAPLALSPSNLPIITVCSGIPATSQRKETTSVSDDSRPSTPDLWLAPEASYLIRPNGAKLYESHNGQRDPSE